MAKNNVAWVKRSGIREVCSIVAVQCAYMNGGWIRTEQMG